jgi:methylthioribose-1-phosphate isomerase
LQTYYILFKGASPHSFRLHAAAAGALIRYGFMTETIRWTAEAVIMIDQTRLPFEEKYVACRTYQEVADAIRDMIIRGAPAIGVAAAMGVARGVLDADDASLDAEFPVICDALARTRPTAVNLFWAIERMRRLYESLRGRPAEEIRRRLVQEAQLVREEDIAINRAIGRHGATLVPDGKTVLTHCNAGALATAGYGTALGVIRAAIESGKKIDVYADETRPFLQGARLTVWELQQDGIPTTLITDNMAGHFMKSGRIGCVVVGADRIAANGDVANKVGTYSVAVLAKENGVPFFVAAPVSTLDLTLESGDRIPIEQRPAAEVTHVFGHPVAPEGTAVLNPAFDVTPARYVSAIITEKGVARAPYEESLRRMA